LPLQVAPRARSSASAPVSVRSRERPRLHPRGEGEPCLCSGAAPGSAPCPVRAMQPRSRSRWGQPTSGRGSPLKKERFDHSSPIPSIRRATAAARPKIDSVDARTLAHLFGADLLLDAWTPSACEGPACSTSRAAERQGRLYQRAMHPADRAPGHRRRSPWRGTRAGLENNHAYTDI
jgi:hypothetical protein